MCKHAVDNYEGEKREGTLKGEGETGEKVIQSDGQKYNVASKKTSTNYPRDPRWGGTKAGVQGESGKRIKEKGIKGLDGIRGTAGLELVTAEER